MAIDIDGRRQTGPADSRCPIVLHAISSAIILGVRIVVGTNVLVGAVMSAEHANRAVLRRCLQGLDIPLLCNALFSEMREVLDREPLFRKSPISPAERMALFEAFCASAEWLTPYFLWRPNLRDEADNHLVELAVDGGASALVTRNARDFKTSELRFAELHVVSPIDYLAVAGRQGD